LRQATELGNFTNYPFGPPPLRQSYSLGHNFGVKPPEVKMIGANLHKESDLARPHAGQLNKIDEDRCLSGLGM
jgi:hypothetical protein